MTKVDNDDALRQAAVLIGRAMTDGITPGLVAMAGVRGEVQGRWALDTSADTVFDLASLTKVMATLPAVLSLSADGSIDLDAPVGRYLPRWAFGPVTVRSLLTHTSGLPADDDSCRRATGRAELFDAVYRVAPAGAPGYQVVYSDIGFLLLGEVIEAVTGAALAEVVAERVFAPLGCAARFCPPDSWRARCAPTEVVDGTAIIGRVHDEKAWAAGGAAGSAGLFATADDVAQYAAWWAGVPVPAADALVPVDLRQAALSCATPGLAGRRGLGWVCRGDEQDVLTESWGPAAVGHTGFTGTSIAIDPLTGRWAVLLTNAVHFGRDNRVELRELRTAFHSALVGDRP